MRRNRELPEIQINGRLWLVDVDGYQIVDKENPENRISALQMQYSDEGYWFAYSKKKQSLVKPFNPEPGDVVYVNLFHFTDMDPEGVAKKYGLRVAEVEGKTDYEIMTDKQVLISRLQGKLTTVDIYGDIYYVDPIMEALCPKDHFLHNEIEFADLIEFYNKETGQCEIPYDYRKQQVADIDRNTIVEHPPCVVIVSLPEPTVMDPMGYAEAYDFNPVEILEKIPQKTHFKGEILQGKDSWLSKLIEENRKQLGWKKPVQKRKGQKL